MLGYRTIIEIDAIPISKTLIDTISTFDPLDISFSVSIKNTRMPRNGGQNTFDNIIHRKFDISTYRKKTIRRTISNTSGYIISSWDLHEPVPVTVGDCININTIVSHRPTPLHRRTDYCDAARAEVGLEDEVGSDV